MQALFRIVNETDKFKSDVGSGVKDTFGSGAGEPAFSSVPRESSKGFTDAMAERMETQLFRQSVMGPLNQVTGGAAGQAYKLGSAMQVGTSAAIGGAVGSVAVWAAMQGLQKLEERMAKMEAKAAAANEWDNILIRNGTKSFTTEYKSNLIGTKSTDRR